MRTLQSFDAGTVELAGQRLIEASAGTGKTYTIAALYLRLVLECGFAVGRILVVTFTRAATAELAGRIRQRLAEARRELDRTDDHKQIEDAFLRLLVQRSEQQPEALRRRLDNALRGFDEAAIFTIHGFCQRVLADRAFESGMAFETELETDVSERLSEIVDDFWRRNFYTAEPLLVDWLLGKGYSPEQLLQDIRGHLGKPYLHKRRAVASEALREIEQHFAEAYERVRILWSTARDQVIDRLAEALRAGALKANQYKLEQLPIWVEQLDAYLGSVRPDPNLPDKFVQFTADKLCKAEKKGHTAPRHPFFDHCQALSDARTVLQENFEARLHNLRAELLDYADTQLRVRKQRDRVQSYDDLLLNLDRALKHDHLGPQLANAVRKRYPAALIDEFQDTDPLQYRVFRRIYAESDGPLFLVGDPKQAIYSFRGADIFAYLQARDDARQQLTLTRNWRSAPALIRAVNTLFDGHEAPFLLPEIGFHPAEPAPRTDRPALRIEDEEGRAPLQLWFLHDPTGAKQGVLNKQDASRWVSQACAAEIARLLNLAAAERAWLGDRFLQGGDIAVLVRTHDEGARIRRELLKLGIPSVQRSRDDVFATPEAEQLERLLLAVLYPARDGWVRAALSTDLIGFDAAALLACEQDEQVREQQLDRLLNLRDIWQQRGFALLFRQLLRVWEIPQRVLGFDDGERRLTNLLHLGELLQTATLQQRLAPESLLSWLAEHRQSAVGEAEAHLLRLESDEQLVQIVTLHKSKGLQYPIVFYPFGWSSGRGIGKDALVAFHDEQANHRAVLDFGSPQREQARQQAEYERLAENLRLLYVGLTRAEQRCYLAWGAINQAGDAAPAWLFHQPSSVLPGQDRFDSARAYYQALDAAAVRRDLESLVDRAGGGMALSEPPFGPGQRYRPAHGEDVTLRARSFTGPIRGQWRIGSFSALTSGHSGGAQPLLPVEQPDHDALTDGAGGPRNDIPTGGIERGIADFPRGARAGSCLHEIFEWADFTRASAEDCAPLVEKTLSRHGFDIHWTSVVAALVERVLSTPLNDAGLQLCRITREQRLDELEFHYPSHGKQRPALRQLLLRHGTWPEPLRRHISTLDIALPTGYMKGFIDLVFEADGCYYVVDYKSNWLGRGPDDYRTEALAEAMAESSYYLQYLIYTLALHRYLQLRLPGYDYSRHFGGVFYLFLRGMDPARPGSGVFADRPSVALIEALDRVVT